MTAAFPDTTELVPYKCTASAARIPARTWSWGRASSASDNPLDILGLVLGGLLGGLLSGHGDVCIRVELILYMSVNRRFCRITGLIVMLIERRLRLGRRTRKVAVNVSSR